MQHRLKFIVKCDNHNCIQVTGGRAHTPLYHLSQLQFSLLTRTRNRTKFVSRHRARVSTMHRIRTFQDERHYFKNSRQMLDGPREFEFLDKPKLLFLFFFFFQEKSRKTKARLVKKFASSLKIRSRSSKS